jgi:RND family efflux transporter MFP subunit
MRLGIVLLALSLLAGCSGFGSKASQDGKESAAPSEPAVAVTVVAIEARDMERPVFAVGTLDPNAEVVVVNQVEGPIEKVLVNLGDAVEAGQTLATIDTRELDLSLRQQRAALDQELARVGLTDENAVFDESSTSQVRSARAAFDDARLSLERARKLYDENLVSRQLLDQAQARHDTADAALYAAKDAVRNIRAGIAAKRAALDLAAKKLADSRVVAPFAGFVKEKIAADGQFLKNGSPVVVLVQNNPLRLRVEVPESAIQTVRPGRTVHFNVDAWPDRQFEGKIAHVAPILDEQSRTLRLEATVNNDAGLLKPGLFARVTIQTGRREKALVAPAEAIFTVAGLEKVFIVEENRVTERLVRSGVRVADRIEILEGVKEGERVAVSNLGNLQQGREVAVQ